LIDSSFKSVVWITGAGGLIGNYLLRMAPQFASDCDSRGLARNDLELLDAVAVRKAFNEQRPDGVIHCAAMSKSPDCQAQPELARKINVEATARLAELASEIPFVFYSSDLVFDGRKGNYIESDAVNPLGIYAETKVVAEKIVLANPRHTVIRTSLNGGISPTGDRGFNEQMRHSWKAGQTLKLFADEFRCPIPAVVTARVTWELLSKGHTGLFHVAGSERLSRARMGKLIASRWPQLQPKFVVTSLEEYSGAPRSPDTSLNCNKVQKLLSFPLPGLSEWLAANPNEQF
jgi:dTDP-4-dehydrorhamnose reductase